jgi:hypothetical protein
MKLMPIPIGHSLSDLASPDNEKDGKDEEDDAEDTKLGKLSQDDKTSWLMGTIFKMVQNPVEKIRQITLSLDQLMPQTGFNTANSFRQRDMMYGMVKLMVVSVVKAHTVKNEAEPA